MLATKRFEHYLGGQYIAPRSGTYLPSINPDDESVVAEIALGNEEDVDIAVRSAAQASAEWSRLRPLERGRILIDVGRKLHENIDILAKLESDEMGMPLEVARGVLKTAATYFEYYGGLAPSVQGDNIPVGADRVSFTTHEPYGIVGIITPWNAPLNQTARSLAPALAVGNTVVQKPSEFTSLTALVFAEKAVEAGLPPGVWNVVTGLGAEVGEPLVRHPEVAKVAFTGSVATGRKIGAIAADKIMPVTLELGGKSPDILFEDADLAKALPGVIRGFAGNSGQVCLAGSRILVQRSIYEQVSRMLVSAVAGISLGRGLPQPSLGPIANKAQFDKVRHYFEVAAKDGATLLTGGDKAEGKTTGYYVKPTLYGDVDMSMRIAREEIFGPVGVLIPFDTEEEAVAIANDSDYGLAAGLWTRDVSRVHRVASQLKAGQIFVNHYFDDGVESPMGGYKKSGIGREKGMVALKQYTHIKNVIIEL